MAHAKRHCAAPLGLERVGFGLVCYKHVATELASFNDKDHRSRAGDARVESATHSRGSVHPAC